MERRKQPGWATSAGEPSMLCRHFGIQAQYERCFTSYLIAHCCSHTHAVTLPLRAVQGMQKLAWQVPAVVLGGPCAMTLFSLALARFVHGPAMFGTNAEGEREHPTQGGSGHTAVTGIRAGNPSRMKQAEDFHMSFATNLH